MMKKKLLLLTVAVCAFMLLGSASVFAADLDLPDADREYTVVCEEVGADEGTLTTSDYWELTDEQIDYALDYLGVPYDLMGMIHQSYNSDYDSVVYLEFYYGQTVVAHANVNRYTGAIVNKVKYYTPAVFSMKDVSSYQWFYDEVKFVYDCGLIMGTDLTTFSPDAPTTRGMLVTILYRMDGEPDVYGSNPFGDVKYTDYFYAPVIWGSTSKIVNGVGGGKFAPNSYITREQMATMLYRFAESYGLYVGDRGNITGYADYNRIGGYAKEAMSWACGIGLMQGQDARHLAPLATATRAEMATMITRFLLTYVE